MEEAKGSTPEIQIGAAVERTTGRPFIFLRLGEDVNVLLNQEQAQAIYELLGHAIAETFSAEPEPTTPEPAAPQLWGYPLAPSDAVPAREVTLGLPETDPEP